MLKVDKVNFFYNKIQILRNISLRVNDGEFVSVIGPNGHGKSTLLKTICGLLTPISGSIKFENKEIIGLPVQNIVEMGLVYIAEDRHLFPEMTILENLKMGAYSRRARAKEKENLEYVFHLFPKLKVLSKHFAASLSGGEARMLAIARGLMSNPKFLAIDEPSFGLAPNLKVKVFKTIDEIKRKGTSILLVEQSIITSNCIDRVYALEDGKFVFEGTKEDSLKNENIIKSILGT